MLRRIIASVAVCLFCVGLVLAADYKGQLTSLDTEGKTLKVKVGDTEKTIKIDDSTQFVKGKAGAKDVGKEELAKISKRLNKAAREVEVTTTGEGEKEVATRVVFKKASK